MRAPHDGALMTDKKETSHAIMREKKETSHAIMRAPSWGALITSWGLHMIEPSWWTKINFQGNIGPGNSSLFIFFIINTKGLNLNLLIRFWSRPLASSKLAMKNPAYMLDGDWLQHRHYSSSIPDYVVSMTTTSTLMPIYLFYSWLCLCCVFTCIVNLAWLWISMLNGGFTKKIEDIPHPPAIECF